MTSSGLFARGSRRLSVEDLNDCAVSDRLELLRCRKEGKLSPKVAARFRGRCRRGDRLDLEVELARLESCAGMALIVRSCGPIPQRSSEQVHLWVTTALEAPKHSLMFAASSVYAKSRTRLIMWMRLAIFMLLFVG